MYASGPDSLMSDTLPAPTRPFDWNSPCVLWGYALHPARSPLGVPCPDPPDLAPAWTRSLERPDFGPRPLARVDGEIAALLGGRVGPATWRGTFALAARVLSMLDALVVSRRVSLAAELDWQVAIARFSPAPGGALEELLDLSWRGACALFDQLPRVPPLDDLDSPACLEALAAALSPIAPIPAWALDRWGGDPAAPPAASRPPGWPGRRRAPTPLCGGARSLPQLVKRLLARSRGVRHRHLLTVVRPSLPTAPLLVYQALAEDMLWSARVALRLAAHIHFRVAVHRAVLAGRFDIEPCFSRRHLAQALDAVRELRDMDPDIFVGQLSHVRDRRSVPPEWLVASEYWLARLWAVHGREALAASWRVTPEDVDHPDHVGPGRGVGVVLRPRLEAGR